MLPKTASINQGAEAHYRALESLYAAAPINRLFNSTGDEAARGTGTFMRSNILLSSLAGYQQRVSG